MCIRDRDSKVLDNDGFDGQLSFGEDTFYQKYEKQIERLTEKFMPPKDEDGQKRSLHKQEMEKYADYRNYLTFSMYERVEDEHGNVKKNSVDEMAGRDSGGEGQNPKYVALLAGFAMPVSYTHLLYFHNGTLIIRHHFVKWTFVLLYKINKFIGQQTVPKNGISSFFDNSFKTFHYKKPLSMPIIAGLGG